MRQHRVARLVLLSWIVAAWGVINPCAAQEVNVTSRPFSAKGDEKTNDLEAFKAAIAAAPVVRVPKGKYKLYTDNDPESYKNLIIDRTVKLIGDGPGFAGVGGSELLFAPGCGIINTVYCAIRDLRITGEPVPGLLKDPASVWQRLTPYKVGDVVRPKDDNRYYFECIKEGTSGDKQPKAWGEVHIPSYTEPWEPNKEYKYTRAEGSPYSDPLGSVVRRKSDFDRIFECTRPLGQSKLSGTSGGSEPTNWSLTPNGATFDGIDPNNPRLPDIIWRTRDATGYLTQDGGVVWEAKVHAGVQMRERCEVSNCFIFNFSNAGVHIQAGNEYVPPRNCNTWYLSRVNISYCGLGVAIAGDLASAGYSEGLSMMPVGQTWTHRLTEKGEDAGVLGVIPGKGGVGIHDYSFLGCTHVGAHVENAIGAAYIADNLDARSVFLGCYAEAAEPNKVTANNIVVGGHQPNNFTADSDGPRFSNDFMNLKIVDRKIVTTTDGQQTLLHGYSIVDNATTQVDVTVTAFQNANAGPGSPDGATFVLRGAWFNAGGITGTTIELKSPIPPVDRSHTGTSKTWDAILKREGPTVHLYVTGEKDKIIMWEVVHHPNLNFVRPTPWK